MPDELDRAQESEEKFKQGALNQALSRPTETPLEEDGVRLCLDCETPIIKARLMANPHAARCVRCQAQTEKG